MFNIFDKPDREDVIKDYAKNNRTVGTGNVRAILDHGGGSMDSELDSLSHSMINFDGMSNEVKDAIKVNGLRHLSSNPSLFHKNNELDRYAELVGNDVAKDSGKDLAKKGINSEFGHSVAQARMASMDERFKAFASHANPFGASARNAWAQSIGITGRDAKIYSSTVSSHLMQNIVPRAVGAFMAYDALTADNPMEAYATNIAAGAASIYGWRSGKALGNLIKPTHFARMGVGGIAAGLATAMTVGSIAGQSDLFSNESFIAKRAKKMHTRTDYTYLKDTSLSLSLRRSALEKLSSSALNNRGQLLGNEAQILRNSQA